jgi:uncharacterized protein
MLGYLIALGVAYLALLVLLRIFENSIIFYPNFPGRLEGNWQPAGLSVEDVWLHTADGVKLHAWWIPAQDAKFTFLAFQGNASNIANRADTYRFLHEVPVNVLAVQYRGYGKSEGSPDEAGIYLDGEAGYLFLTKMKNIPAGQVISYGQSLGTAVAADVAWRFPCGGVVLEAPFPSARTMARRAFPFLPGAGLVAKSKLETARKLAAVSAPKLIVHCVDDPVIPFALGEETFRSAQEPKTFLPVGGTCHEEASWIAPEKYRAALREFLQSIASGPKR